MTMNIYNDRIQVEELKPPEASFNVLYFIVPGVDLLRGSWCHSVRDFPLL